MTMLLREKAIQANLMRWDDARDRYVLTGTGRRRVSARSRATGTVVSFRKRGVMCSGAPCRKPANTNLRAGLPSSPPGSSEKVQPLERNHPDLRFDRYTGGAARPLAQTQPFRIQFIRFSSGRATLLLDEVQIEASDASAAIIAAACAAWPPQTKELRILDRNGRQVFERKAKGRQPSLAPCPEPARTLAARPLILRSVLAKNGRSESPHA